MNFALSDFKDNIDLGRVFELSNSIMKAVNSNKIKNKGDYLISSWGDGRKYKIGYEGKSNIVLIHREA